VSHRVAGEKPGMIAPRGHARVPTIIWTAAKAVGAAAERIVAALIPMGAWCSED